MTLLENYNYIQVVINDDDIKSIEKWKPILFTVAHKRPSVIRYTRKSMENQEWMVSALTHPSIEQLKQNSKFDLVILEYFYNDFNIGIAAHFRCPSILITSHAMFPSLGNMIGNPSAAAFVQSRHVANDDRWKRMTFLQRVMNHLTLAIEQILVAAHDYFYNQAYYADTFPSHKGYAPYEEAKRNVSMVFVSSHFSQNGPLLSFPAVREISGIHIPNVVNALPRELQEWFDASDEDVIYMSFGSFVNSTDMGAEKRNAFVSVFKRLRQWRILWKWDADHLANCSENIRISKWLPQLDILAHPKVKLFISHGGLGGLSEARYRGVPVLGIPLFGDQTENVESIVTEGWAKKLIFSSLTEENFEEVLRDILTNEEYQVKAKEASQLYRDRPMHPLDEALYWVEYVLRHSGAKHIQSQAVHLNWLQYHSLDVFGFLFLLVLIVWNTLRHCLRKKSAIIRNEKKKIS